MWLFAAVGFFYALQRRVLPIQRAGGRVSSWDGLFPASLIRDVAMNGESYAGIKNEGTSRSRGNPLAVSGFPSCGRALAIPCFAHTGPRRPQSQGSVAFATGDLAPREYWAGEAADFMGSFDTATSQSRLVGVQPSRAQGGDTWTCRRDELETLGDGQSAAGFERHASAGRDHAPPVNPAGRDATGTAGQLSPKQPQNGCPGPGVMLRENLKIGTSPRNQVAPQNPASVPLLGTAAGPQSHSRAPQHGDLGAEALRASRQGNRTRETWKSHWQRAVEPRAATLCRSRARRANSGVEDQREGLGLRG